MFPDQFLQPQKTVPQLVFPSLDNYVSNQVPVDIRGRLLGIYRSTGLIGSILGTSITGYIGSKFWTFSPFIVMAVLMILGTVVSFRFLVSQQK